MRPYAWVSIGAHTHLCEHVHAPCCMRANHCEQIHRVVCAYPTTVHDGQRRYAQLFIGHVHPPLMYGAAGAEAMYSLSKLSV